jgi:hypothetical protein
MNAADMLCRDIDMIGSLKVSARPETYVAAFRELQ